jgi:hypothetical protein
VPALAFSVIGLSFSEAQAIANVGATNPLGDPHLFQWLAHLLFAPLPDGHETVCIRQVTLVELASLFQRPYSSAKGKGVVRPTTQW